MPTGLPTTNSTNKYPNVKQLSWAINYTLPNLLRSTLTATTQYLSIEIELGRPSPPGRFLGKVSNNYCPFLIPSLTTIGAVGGTIPQDI